MNTIHIPGSIGDAVDQLGSVERLLTAKRWERAAIVAAFVRLNEFGDNQHSEGRTSTTLSPNAFADLGIAGLKSDATVRLYVTRWLESHDGIYPEAGAEVALPDDAQWESTRTGTDGAESPEGMAKVLDKMVEKHGSAAVAEAIEQTAPEVVNDAVGQRQSKPKPKPVVTDVPDEIGERMDTMAMLRTAAGHATAIKLRHDKAPESFEVTADALKLRKLSDAFGMLADMVVGVSVDDLTELLDEVGQ
jgi:hypothetical protein